MNQLYPIIRRKRRPLMAAESVPDGPVGKVPRVVEPVEAEALRAQVAEKAMLADHGTVVTGAEEEAE